MIDLAIDRSMGISKTTLTEMGRTLSDEET